MKRFIAGASCPQCSQTDSLYFETKEQDQVFCSRCDYQAQRATELPNDDEPGKEVNSEQDIKWH